MNGPLIIFFARPNNRFLIRLGSTQNRPLHDRARDNKSKVQSAVTHRSARETSPTVLARSLRWHPKIAAGAWGLRIGRMSTGTDPW